MRQIVYQAHVNKKPFQQPFGNGVHFIAFGFSRALFPLKPFADKSEDKVSYYFPYQVDQNKIEIFHLQVKASARVSLMVWYSFNFKLRSRFHIREFTLPKCSATFL